MTARSLARTGLTCLWLAAAAAHAATDWGATRTEALGVFQALLRLDTSNPPGRVTPAVDLLDGLLRREGIATRRYVTDGPRGVESLLARLPGRSAGKPLLLLAHLDVVPVEPARWLVPPFAGLVQGGEVWGRGAIDMKDLAVMELFAMISLKREGIVPARDLLLLFDGDEEVGGALGAKWMTEHAWSDLDPAYVLDEGGAGTTSVYTGDGRIVFGLAVEEKKVLWLKLTAAGEGGHGSRPTSRNPARTLSRALGRIAALEPQDRSTPVVAEMERRLGRLADNPVTRALRHATITITSLRAGVGDPPKTNVIPDHAEATIDCRLLPGDSVEETIALVRACLGGDPDLTLEVTQRPQSPEPPPARWDTPLYRALESAITAAIPGSVTVPVVMTGGTDARFFRARGVPAYGFDPTVRTPERQALFHSHNERLAVAEFNRGLKLYHDALASFLR